MELESLIENLDFENNKYFYHITGKGYGNDIMNEGLYLKENRLSSTTIELPEEMIQNPIEYCTGEYSNGEIKRQEMVIIVCEEGEENYIVNRCDVPKFIGLEHFNYIINPENILGYIDLETLEYTGNNWCEYGGRNV